MEILPTDSRRDRLPSAVQPAPCGHAVWADPATLFAWGYLVALVAAEVTTILIEPRVGLVLYGTLLVLLLTHAVLQSETELHRLLLSLTLVPLIRIFSLSLPLADLPASVRFLLGSLQLLIAVALVARRLRFSWRAVGLNLRKPRAQCAIAAGGLLIGPIEFLLLRPDPLASASTRGELLLLVALLLACAAFAEELVFRGVLQHAAGTIFGSPAVVYVAILFTALHLGDRSWLDLLLVFAVALFFGRAVASTGSIVGVVVARWLINLLLFLVLPSLF